MKSAQKRTDMSIYFTDADFRAVFQPTKASSIDNPASISKTLHEEIELKYFYEGSSTTVEVSEGDLVIINPYEPHSTIRFGESGGRYRFLMLDLDFFLEGSTGGLDLRSILLKKGITFQTLIRGDSRISDIMYRMTEVFTEKKPYWRFAMRGVMLELFSLLLNEYSVKPKEKAGGSFRGFETVEPALRKIREDYALPITLDELTRLCNVSKCHFCRLFRNATGQSPMRYLTEYRLKIANIMLSSSEDSIGSIAERCGFVEQTYFCQCYKTRYGVSPTQDRIKKTTKE